jgi:hypothetical protein
MLMGAFFFQAFLWGIWTPMCFISHVHLLFVYYTLIFYGTNPDHIHCLCALFLCFEVVFGQTVNLAKSKLVPAMPIMLMAWLAF